MNKYLKRYITRRNENLISLPPKDYEMDYVDINKLDFEYLIQKSKNLIKHLSTPELINKLNITNKDDMDMPGWFHRARISQAKDKNGYFSLLTDDNKLHLLKTFYGFTNKLDVNELKKIYTHLNENNKFFVIKFFDHNLPVTDFVDSLELLIKVLNDPSLQLTNRNFNSYLSMSVDLLDLNDKQIYNYFRLRDYIALNDIGSNEIKKLMLDFINDNKGS